MDGIQRKITKAARKVGFRTPIGKRLSLVAEQLRNGVSPAQTIRDIEQIRCDGGRYVHANHFRQS